MKILMELSVTLLIKTPALSFGDVVRLLLMAIG